MHRHLSFQCTLVLIAAVLLSACGPEVATPEVKPTEAPTLTPLPRNARIIGLNGLVQVQAAGAAEFSTAALDQLLFAGDSMQTGADGEAVLEMDDHTILVVAPNSLFTVTALEGTPSNPITRFLMNVGQIFSIRGEALPADATYEIETPQGVALIRGSAMSAKLTENARLETNCLIGQCGAAIGDQSVDLASGLTVGVEAGVVSEVAPMDPSQQQEWVVALDAAEQAGVDVDAALEGDQCDCEGTNYVCQDGTVLYNFAACLPGPGCRCDGPTLVCGDQRLENDPACAPIDLSGCTCGEADLVTCEDGRTYIATEGSCLSGKPCVCQGTNWVCFLSPQTAIYQNDPICGFGGEIGPICFCDEGILTCDNGTTGSC